MEDSSADPEPAPIRKPVLDLQIACVGVSVPTKKRLHTWYSACLPAHLRQSEVTVRVVDEQESRTLNASFRQKDKPTNVLSFPSEIPKELGIPFLGDLVICANIVKQESAEQNKSEDAHWAHMIVHGTLHLIGYDHEQDVEAEEMEALETHILQGLGFASPYDTSDTNTPKGNLQ